MYVHIWCILLYIWCVYIYMCVCVCICIPHSSVNRHLGCCYVLAIVNSTVRIILIQFLCVLL